METNLHKQKISAKQSVTQRLNSLIDSNSFEEIGHEVTSPFLEKPFTTDGVITGFGTIRDKQVALYAQDFSNKGGSLGKRHAEKICRIMDLAAKIGCPIIGLIDSGGARIDEGIHALDGYGELFMRNVRYSGIIPQFSLILGPCAGGASYSPALTDFVFMVENISTMFITGPEVIKKTTHEHVTKEDLGGPHIHTQQSGVAHLVLPTEQSCFDALAELVTMLPSNYLDYHTEPDPSAHTDCSITHLVPEQDTLSYNMRDVIEALFDDNSFFELHQLFAPNIIVGFAYLANVLVGLVANQPAVKAGTIDRNASVKAARFVQFCDSFSIPLISLVDVPGFLPGVEQEHSGIIRDGAKLLHAYAEATVPKITVIIRKAFGGAYIVMGSKPLGADFVFSWPKAKIAVLGAPAAINILHRKKLAAAREDERDDLRCELENDYTQQFLNPHSAAHAGYIDAIIDPNTTRHHLIRALTITQTKVEQRPKKKHGNGPL